jgi:cell fate regulator YaaT (PSP1 superfamily)
MGCGSCGTSKNGALPSGCKDHGSCRSGGCNRLNVHDWLSLIPVADFSKPFPFIEVSFNHGSRKDYYRASNPLLFEKGDYVTLESTGGYDIGVVSVTGELVKLQMKKKNVSEKSEDIKRVLHISTEAEIAKMDEVKKNEQDFMIKSRVIARNLKLDMKIAEVEIQADGKKATFFYTAEDRVDFRELIKQFAADFRVKIEMRQIGIRQEAAKVGGIGSCGRELCCSTWLNDFKSVSTTAARYQNLSINQTKLSGQCGRLKCCLNYELDTYMDALRVFPDNAEKIRTKQGLAFLQKRDIFKNLMWYSFEKSNTLYPLTIDRVNEIVELNKNGVFPEELQAVEVVKKAAIAEKTDFVDVVGQFSLKGLERASKKKKQKAKTQGSKPAEAGKPANQANPNQAQKTNQPRPKQENPKPQGNKPQQGQQQGQGQKPQGNKPQGNKPQQGQGQGKPAQPNPNPNQKPQQQGQGHKPQQSKAPQNPGENPSQQANKPQQGQGQKPRPQGKPKGPKPQENKPNTGGEAS